MFIEKFEFGDEGVIPPLFQYLLRGINMEEKPEITRKVYIPGRREG
jgi:hypothetical protein